MYIRRTVVSNMLTDLLFPGQPGQRNVKTLSLGCILRPDPIFSLRSKSIAAVFWGINVGIATQWNPFKVLEFNNGGLSR